MLNGNQAKDRVITTARDGWRWRLLQWQAKLHQIRDTSPPEINAHANRWELRDRSWRNIQPIHCFTGKCHFITCFEQIPGSGQIVCRVAGAVRKQKQSAEHAIDQFQKSPDQSGSSSRKTQKASIWKWKALPRLLETQKDANRSCRTKWGKLQEKDQKTYWRGWHVRGLHRKHAPAFHSGSKSKAIS